MPSLLSGQALKEAKGCGEPWPGRLYRSSSWNLHTFTGLGQCYQAEAFIMQCDLKSSVNQNLTMLITVVLFHPPHPVMHICERVRNGGLRIAPLKERLGLITLTPTPDPTEIPT